MRRKAVLLLKTNRPMNLTMQIPQVPREMLPPFRTFCFWSLHNSKNKGSPESVMSKIITQIQCLQVTKLSVWFSQVQSFQNNVS